MDKLALMFVGVFMLAGMSMVLKSQSNIMESESRMAEDSYEILARNAALAGLDRAKQMLSDNFQTYYAVTGTNDNIAYGFDAEVVGNTVVVHSVGTAVTSQNEEVAFNVQAKFKQRTEIPTKAPMNMRYAVMSEEDLLLRGGVDGDVYADGEADNELNANFHTNKNLQVNGKASSVKGFGTFCLTASPSVAGLSDIFVPNHNPSNADHVFHTSTVQIDPMVPSSIASAVTLDSTTAGNAELQGTYDLGGTREDPYVWHVQGNLLIKGGGTTINGYTMFLVDGEVDIRGNAEVGGVSYEGGDESSVAFYTGDGVRTRGNIEVWGQIYSEGGIEFAAGNPTIYGSVTTRGAVDFRGNVQIYYRKASPALTRTLQPDLTLLDRLTYSEW